MVSITVSKCINLFYHGHNHEFEKEWGKIQYTDHNNINNNKIIKKILLILIIVIIKVFIL